MDDDPGVVTHPTIRMWLRVDCTVQAVMAPGATLSLEGAIAAARRTGPHASSWRAAATSCRPPP